MSRRKTIPEPIALVEPFPPYSHGVVWKAVVWLNLLDWIIARGGYVG